MKPNPQIIQKLAKVLAPLAAAAGLSFLTVCPMLAQVTAPRSFEESAFLYREATDSDFSNSFGSGDGDWSLYKSWLNAPALGAETDPANWDNWFFATENNYNALWGSQQARYGTGGLPDLLLGVSSMPSGDPTYSEDQFWQMEAQNNPIAMQHFVNLGKNIAAWKCKSVIIRLDYEFDGNWDPYGNLQNMTGMPGTFISAWQNVVNTIRTTVKQQDPSISVKFLWNPTDSNATPNLPSALFYPGDAYVDYIGFDNYDVDSYGYYQFNTQPSAANQLQAWNSRILPHIQWFSDFASAANPYHRNGYAGRAVPLIVGEWGLWEATSSYIGAGGDDPVYVQNMYNWMSNPKNNVYMESCFETYANNSSHQLWPGGYLGQRGNPNWAPQSPFPNAAAKYRDLFGFSYSYGASPASIPGTVQAASYDTGGPGIAYQQPYNAGQTGSRSDNSGADYGIGIGWTGAGNWYKYTVNVASAGPYTVSCTINAPFSGGTFHLEDKSGTNLTGPIVCPATGDWSTPGLAPATAIMLPAGTQVLKWVQDTGGFNLLSMKFTAGGAATPSNYALNGGFETGSLSSWNLWWNTNPGAAYASSGYGEAQTGAWGYVNWSPNPYELTLYQNIAVPNGPHTVSAWVKSCGGQWNCQMEVTTNGVETIVPVPPSSTWEQISTPVYVSNGSVTVGFYSNAAANQWLNVDDVVVK